jgi:hypothetical protein
MKVAITLEIARVLGYFMGDGSFHAGVFEVSVDAQDQDIRQEVSRVIQEASGRKPTEKKQGKMWRIQSSNQKWLEVLKALDCVEPAIHKNLGRSCGWKRKVHVPACILESPKEVVREFLSALFECDGHAYRDAARVVLFSKSDDFLREIQLLLLGFGIRARFEKKQIKHTSDGHQYQGRSLMIAAAFANKFYDEIGFRSNRKQLSGKRRSEERTWGVSSGELIDEVLTIEDTERKESVFDITVCQTHQFSANGILVHNSDSAAFQGSYDNVFGKPLIAEIFSERDTCYDVFGIIGQSIEERHEPDVEEIDWDPTMVRVPIKWKSRKGEHFNWTLVPLAWREPFQMLADIRDDNTGHMGKLFVYMPPEPGYDYSEGVDTSNGIGHDATAIAMSRRGTNNDEPDIQAAEFRDNNVSHVEAFAWAAAIGAYYSRYMTPDFGWLKPYRNPYLSIEQVASVGDTCQFQMRKLGFGRFHRMVRYDSKPQKMRKIDANKEGWYTFSYTRAMLTDTFVVLVQNKWYQLNSPYTIWEADHWEVHYTDSGKNKFEHSEDTTDDGLFANALAAFCPNDQKSMADRTARQFRADPDQKAPKLDIGPTHVETVSRSAPTIIVPRRTTIPYLHV